MRRARGFVTRTLRLGGGALPGVWAGLGVDIGVVGVEPGAEGAAEVVTTGVAGATGWGACAGATGAGTAANVRGL